MTRLPSLIAVLSAAALAAGCGNAAPKGSGGGQDRHIYVSVGDCAKSGKLDLDKCEKAIDRALVANDEKGTRHKKLKDCEDAVGLDNCERTGADFRPRPVAYLVTSGSQPVAAPLYASKAAATFKALDATAYDPNKPAGVVFSPASEELAQTFVKKRGKK